MVANFVYRNDVDGLINAALGGNAKRSVAAQSLNVHAADFEACTFKQKAVVVELDTPVEQVAHSVVTKLRPEFRLPLLEPRLVDFAGVNFDFVNPPKLS